MQAIFDSYELGAMTDSQRHSFGYPVAGRPVDIPLSDIRLPTVEDEPAAAELKEAREAIDNAKDALEEAELALSSARLAIADAGGK